MDEYINWKARGELYSKTGHCAKAVECFDKALEINQRTVERLELRGADLVERGHEQEAMACFDRVVAITELNVCLWFNKGMVLQHEGKHWEALVSFDKGLEFCPDDEDALRCVDQVLQRLTQAKEVNGD